jgi:hypothetical protein
MRQRGSLARIALAAAVVLGGAEKSNEQQKQDSALHLGFDRNEYPGDEAMETLRKQFAFVGYWLSPPPGEKTNSWKGKRGKLAEQGFGFALLFAGRPGSSLGAMAAAAAAGEADAKRAVETASREGFAEGWLIFLDVEEGGRFSDAAHAYFRAWAGALTREHYRAGFYCSGIVVNEGGGSKVISADDISAHLGAGEAAYWVFNDACPPSPGCLNPKELPPLRLSGVAYAELWQIARSPKEDVARNCRGYAGRNSCYAPVDTAKKWFLDLDVARLANPSAPQ